MAQCDELDFEALAQAYPLLHPYLYRSQSRWTLDFKNLEAQRCLMNAILTVRHHLPQGLVVPKNALVPAVSNRADYLEWVFSLLKPDQNAIGLDIGTGTSCIYPILGYFIWKSKYSSSLSFVATDIDALSVEFARHNVMRNGLSSHISVHVNPDNKCLFPPFLFDQTHYTFTLCNPPFYASRQEKQALASQKQYPAAGTTVATDNEAIVAGGEQEFIETMLEQSSAIPHSVEWFTCFIGFKKTFQHFKQVLHKHTLINRFEYTQVTRGNTTRWMIAWSFVN